LLHAEKVDYSEVEREFRYLSITLFGSDKGKDEQLSLLIRQLLLPPKIVYFRTLVIKVENSVKS
jgi:hypothetical protein